jgi:hypothetical protein
MGKSHHENHMMAFTLAIFTSPPCPPLRTSTQDQVDLDLPRWRANANGGGDEGVGANVENLMKSPETSFVGW